MKYVLILYVCSFLNATNPNCTDSHVVPLEFNKENKENLLDLPMMSAFIVFAYYEGITGKKLKNLQGQSNTL